MMRYFSKKFLNLIIICLNLNLISQLEAIQDFLLLGYLYLNLVSQPIRF